MKWLLVSNKREQNFDLDGALHADGVNWLNNHKVSVGDIAYIYESAPEQYVRYKCVVTEANNRFASVDEVRFGGVRKGSDYESFVTELLYEFNNPVPLKELAKHGVSTKRVSVTRDVKKPELFEFLEEYEVKDRDGTLIDEVEDLSVLSGEEREAVIKVRVNQGRFREGLLKKYNHCCLCAVSSQALLAASHIKPWTESEPVEKTDINNGLLLCPNHDRLFDKGFITFDDDGSIIISEELSENDRMFMNVSDSMEIEMNGRMASFMEYHREHVFRG